MDFKVTGTSVGITACQMDIKIDGLKYDIWRYISKLEMVVYILGKLIETLATPKEDVKAYPKNYKKNSRIHWLTDRVEFKNYKSNWNKYCYQ
jgi:polyribonucleotide nucleotidyltransferase